MIQKFTWLIPSDKNGVKWVKVFHLYKGFYRKKSTYSDFVKISVKKTKPNNLIKKKSKHIGILIRLVKKIKKIDGTFYFFKFNNVILLKKRLTPLGRELYGPVTKELKRRKFMQTFPGLI